MLAKLEHMAPTVSRASRREPPSSVHQMRVTLKGSRPPIWRRVLVKSDISLHRLHLTLQVVMGWTNTHLYQFELDRESYGEPHPDYEGTMLNARTMKLSRIAPCATRRFTYRYDFGDGWGHEVVVEKIFQGQQGVHYPICLGGKRACPPEDCGGIGGYADFLAAIRNPRHPEHESMLDWIGGEFHPEAFDIEDVKAGLRSSP
jgi:hypothetical protein